MTQIPNYFQRVHDFLNDPCFPSTDKYKPWVIVQALWAALWNKKFYR